MIQQIGNLTLHIEDEPFPHKAQQYVLEITCFDGEYEEAIQVDVYEGENLSLLVPLMEAVREEQKGGQLVTYDDLCRIAREMGRGPLLDEYFFEDWLRKDHMVYRYHQWWWHDEQGRAYRVLHIAH
jgi:hypothetical protein